MNNAQMRVKTCIDYGHVSLDLAYMNLTELPSNLPGSLQTLYCYNNRITKLPETLPASLKYLHCQYNQIKKLPNLPKSLVALLCFNNEIDELPNIPTSLKYLYCGYNKLTKLPVNLPIMRLECLECSDNKYLHISKKYATQYGFKETPDYNEMASCIQRIWKAYRCKHIMIKMIHNNNNVLYNSFKSYGDLNIVNLITQYMY